MRPAPGRRELGRKPPRDGVAITWLAALLTLLSGGAPGCRQPAAGQPLSLAPAPEPEAPAPDPFCASGRLQAVRRLVLVEQMQRTAIGSFARLSEEQRRALSALTARPDLRAELTLVGPRLLLTLPASHPAGPLEVLIAEDRDEVIAFWPSPRQRIVLPRHRLPDLLDGTSLTSERGGHELEVEAAELGPEDRLPGRSLKLRALSAQIALHYFPEPPKPRSWSLRVGLRLLSADSPPAPTALDPVLALAAPLLGDPAGLSVLGVVRARSGWPLRWEVSVANESRPASPPVLRGEVLESGFATLPSSVVCSERQGYREARELPRPSGGLQVVPPRELAGLRPATAAGPLEVHNRSKHAAYVYADGILLGWVAAGSRVALRGLPEGFYRIYARSPTGARAWGPHDLYVPGPLTLW